MVGAAGEGFRVRVVGDCMAAALYSKPFRLQTAAGRDDYLLNKADTKGGSVRVAVRRIAPCVTVLGWTSLW